MVSTCLCRHSFAHIRACVWTTEVCTHTCVCVDSRTLHTYVRVRGQSNLYESLADPGRTHGGRVLYLNYQKFIYLQFFGVSGTEISQVQNCDSEPKGECRGRGTAKTLLDRVLPTLLTLDRLDSQTDNHRRRPRRQRQRPQCR